MESKAADIHIPGITVMEMYNCALEVPMFRSGGIGVYQGQHFVHVDVRDGHARWYVKSAGDQYAAIPF